MKRKVFAALAIGAIVFVSCKKEEPATPADPGSATVQGTLWANTNLDNDTDAFGFPMTQYEYVPSGATTVTAFVDSEDLDQNPDPTYDYQTLSWSATVGANGSYVIAGIPCWNDPITVELRFNDFTADQQIGGDDVPHNFELAPIMVTVWDGAIVIQDATFM